VGTLAGIPAETLAYAPAATLVQIHVGKRVAALVHALAATPVQTRVVKLVPIHVRKPVTTLALLHVR
jgi:hypothetical protein